MVGNACSAGRTREQEKADSPSSFMEWRRAAPPVPDIWCWGGGVCYLLTQWEEEGEQRKREMLRGQRGREMEVLLDSKKKKKLKYVSMF